MEKAWFESKSIRGILLAVGGFLWGLWAGETEISKTVIFAGLGYAGIGFRSAMK